MAAAAQTMEFWTCGEYRDLIQAIVASDQATGHGRKICKIGTSLDYYVDRGWMCVQVFFVRQGKLDEQDVNLFPTTMIRMRGLLDLCGTILSRKSHLVPRCWFRRMKRSPIKELYRWFSDFQAPNVEEKNNWSNLIHQMPVLVGAEVQSARKISRKDPRLLKIWDACSKSRPQSVSESFDNSIMGTSPVSAMVVFVNGKPVDYRNYKIKTVVGPDDYASMRGYSQTLWPVQRDGLTIDLIVLMGDKVKSISQSKSSKKSWVWISQLQVWKNDKHQTLDCSLEIHWKWWSCLAILKNSFSSTHPGWVHRFAITLSFLLKVPSFSWMGLTVWDLNTKQVSWGSILNLTKIKGS